MGIRVTFQHRSVAFLPVRYMYVYIYVCKYRYIGTPSQECFTIRRVTYECSGILASGDWTGAKTKGKASIFLSNESTSTSSTDKSNATTQATTQAGLNASKIETVCWNCGQLGHAFTTCPQPRNEQRIASAKSQFMENKNAKKAKKQANVGAAPTNQTNKWRPPTANEDNKRVIDGKHMFYFFKTKRWMLDKRHPSNKSSGDTANTNTTPSTSPNISATSERSSPDLEAALANTTRAIESSLRGLVNQFANV